MWSNRYQRHMTGQTDPPLPRGGGEWVETIGENLQLLPAQVQVGWLVFLQSPKSCSEEERVKVQVQIRVRSRCRSSQRGWFHSQLASITNLFKCSGDQHPTLGPFFF